MDNKQYNILIVDDNSKNIQLAANILKCEQYKLWYAKSGEEALKKVKDIEFDIILMDVMMPGIDGFETSKKIKEVPENLQVPIIFLTAKNTNEDIISGFFHGGVDYIIKPYNPVELKVRVKTHLKLSSQKKELISLNKKLEYMANKDFLTGVNNRGNFFRLGEDIYLNNKEKNIYISMLDIDNFKKLNDTYGHKLGDLALIEFTKEVDKNLGILDIFGRLGGEEFAIITIDTNEQDIIKKLENIRLAIENIKLFHNNKEVMFTVSIGIVKKLENEDLDTTLDRADKQLYNAKDNGRNNIKFRL